MNVLTYAKAIAALLGAVVTSLLAILPPDQYRWLSIVGVILTAVATYRIPNQAAPVDGRHEAGAADPEWDGISGVGPSA